MWNAAEHIEPLAGAANRFREQFAGDARQRDAVSRKSLHEVHIGFESSEVRRSVHGDVDVAAPGMLDSCIGKLREHL